jgi:hypothetical protein
MWPRQWRPLRLCRARQGEMDEIHPYSFSQEGALSYSAALIGP